MERSAANSDKGSKADSSKESASRIKPVGENERKMEIDPLRGLVQGAECRGSACGPSLESVAQRMVSMPGAQRRAAAMSLQRSRGNRFVQGMAAQVPSLVQAKMSTGAIAGLHEPGAKRSVGMQQPVVFQRQADPELEEDEEGVPQGKFESHASVAKPEQVEPRPNRTGMPDRLKAGIESLSGIDMSDVRVHANSNKPSKLNALAYTQGNEIYLGPGQERHLAHEAWHAVQQKQGRVRATLEISGVGLNDEAGLEGEADQMGVKAATKKRPAPFTCFQETDLIGAKSTIKRNHDSFALSINETIPDQSLQKAVHLSQPPRGQPIQRTAWEKKENNWERHTYEKGKYEMDTATELTSPPVQIGRKGWFYSSTTNAFYNDYDHYKAAIRPEKDDERLSLSKPEFNKKYSEPPNVQEGSIMITDLDAEEKLLKNFEGCKIEFSEDVTRNYLLWSVPKYTGENLKGEVTGSKLEDVSGEAKAEEEVKRKEGYMMKQTQEHMEALTALIMIQGDEKIQPKDILAQYGTTVGPFDPSKVDPLHNPRDPEPQSEFISILKLIEDYYKVAKDDKDAAEKQGEVIGKLKAKKISENLLSLLKMSDNNADFNRKFFPHKASELLESVTRGTDPFGSRDKEEEVTRAVLKDETDPQLHLIGGRQAVFDSIWGPKSAIVVKKAAKRLDSVRSHGLKYHWSPKATVQAQYEFPTYLDLIEKELNPLVQSGCLGEKVKEAYDIVIKELKDIISKINSIQPRDKKSATELGEDREKIVKEIKISNDLVESNMGFIRERLQGIMNWEGM